MTKDEIRERIRLEQAYLDGKRIQWRMCDIKNLAWTDFDPLKDNWPYAFYLEYRIHPEDQ